MSKDIILKSYIKFFIVFLFLVLSSISLFSQDYFIEIRQGISNGFDDNITTLKDRFFYVKDFLKDEKDQNKVILNFLDKLLLQYKFCSSKETRKRVSIYTLNDDSNNLLYITLTNTNGLVKVNLYSLVVQIEIMLYLSYFENDLF